MPKLNWTHFWSAIAVATIFGVWMKTRSGSFDVETIALSIVSSGVIAAIGYVVAQLYLHSEDSE